MEIVKYGYKKLTYGGKYEAAGVGNTKEVEKPERA